MAVGYSDGSVAIFRIPSSLSDYQSGDLELLGKVFESKDKVEWQKQLNYNLISWLIYNVE